MAELTEAIARALWAAHRNQNGMPTVTPWDELEREYRALWTAYAAAVAPLVEAAARADERAKVAEEIAKAIETDAEGYIGDELLTGMDFAAAIARQHATARPEDPSHGNSAHVPGEQQRDGTNKAPESHQDATEPQRPYERTPKPAQAN